MFRQKECPHKVGLCVYLPSIMLLFPTVASSLMVVDLCLSQLIIIRSNHLPDAVLRDATNRGVILFFKSS